MEIFVVVVVVVVVVSDQIDDDTADIMTGPAFCKLVSSSSCCN